MNQNINSTTDATNATNSNARRGSQRGRGASRGSAQPASASGSYTFVHESTGGRVDIEQLNVDQEEETPLEESTVPSEPSSRGRYFKSASIRRAEVAGVYVRCVS